MTHSVIEAQEDEMVPFEHVARTRPEGPVLLIDTYEAEGRRGA